ncbi:ABC transporter permease subunit [Williamsia soli]|uniref:ABC transporter permease subunit n=1 Tax=Williamsia soli TaxID=364929 RepID=UPI001A9CC9F1|nr:ATP-binding cassette domain-containing protein [Williamsia soli]
MTVLLFALIGLSTGAIYAMLALGVILVYRGSGLLNFAQGAMALAGGYAYLQFSVRWDLPLGVSLAMAVAFCAVLGVAIQLLVLRPMRESSPLARLIATLGVVMVFQSAAFLIYGHDTLSVPSLLPTDTVNVFTDQLPIGVDRIWILGIGCVLMIALTVTYRRSRFGKVTAAVAENEMVAASLGHSPDVISSVNWALGSALAGLAGALIAPLVFLEPTSMVLLVIPAMTAALVGGFSSFSITFAAALALGVAESLITRYVETPGWSVAAPFIVILVVVIVRGKALPLRSFVLDRLPAVGSGRIRPLVVLPLFALAVMAVVGSDPEWSSAIATTASLSLICLSIVVITGYAGQVSLAQYVLAGLGALIAAKLAEHMSFVPALILAALITALIGALVGMPALRTRGATLAVVTLGLASALFHVVLNNDEFSGGEVGLLVPTPSIFGWDIDTLFHDRRYAFVVVVVVTVACLAVMNLRRSSVGRALLAVRSNERAAAAVGVNVAGAKTYAFSLSAALAATGGVLLAFSQSNVLPARFDVFTCILLVGVTVVGGVGFAGGAILGSALVAGGVVTQLFSGWSEVADYLPLFGGIILIVTLIVGPDGMVAMNRRLADPLFKLWHARFPGKPRPFYDAVDGSSDETVEPKELVVENLTVRFGGVTAVDDVSLTVQPGTIHGVIGPNGAGKTTFIDAVSGFVGAQGRVALGAQDLGRLVPRRRVAAGLSRSFQSLELFADLTIAENLAVASQSVGPAAYLTSMVRPGKLRLTAAAAEAMRAFELEDVAHLLPDQVSFGQRKAAAIARAVAARPSVLLLDEPAAGLDEHEATELADLIRRIAQDWGVGVLLVEHRIDMVMSICDEITVLTRGSVLTSGSPSAIRADNRVAAVYLGVAADAVSAGQGAEHD